MSKESIAKQLRAMLHSLENDETFDYGRSLDSRPPEDAESEFLRIFMPSEDQLKVEDNKEVSKPLKKVGIVYDHCAYALTFTFDLSHQIMKGYDNKELLVNQTKANQVAYFNKQFIKWYDRLCVNLATTMYKVDIPAYEVYTEFTKNGLVHAHGLLYINNSYTSGVGSVMTNIWCSINPGVTWKAMSSKRGRFIDKAFDKCSNIPAWRKYISKEQTELSFDIPCALPMPDEKIDYLIDD